MANESTYALISSLLNPIRDAALMYAMKNTVMLDASLVKEDMEGLQPRINDEVAEGTVIKSLTEGADLLSNLQAFTRNLIGTVTPITYKKAGLLTDERILSDEQANIDNFAKLAQAYTYETFLQLDKDAIGAFSSFTGGTVGAANGTITWGQIYHARGLLESAGVRGPYNVVLHPLSWTKLATDVNIAAGQANPGFLEFRNEIQTNYYVYQEGDLNFFVAPAITSGTAMVQGVYNPEAVLVDIRKPFSLVTQDLRFRGGILALAQLFAGAGVWRPTWGCQLISSSSNLGNAA